MKKSAVGIIISLFMTLFCVPIIAYASSSGKCGDNATWVLDNGLLTISGTGDMTNYVGAIDLDSPFGDDITKVIIEEGITSVGDEAFNGCANLESVTLPSSLKSIGNYSFALCYNLSEVDLPNHLDSIGGYAFEYCAIKSINIGNVASVRIAAFENCRKLTSISVGSNNPNYSEVDGVLYNKDKSKLIIYPCGKTDTQYTMPDSVTAIEGYAITNCNNLTSVVLSKNLEYIGEDAFNKCDYIQHLELPETVTTIRSGAFCTMYNLQSILIPPSVKYLPEHTISGCSNLKSITLSNGLQYIGNNSICFNYNLESIVIPESVTSVDFYTFSGNKNLKSVSIPYSLCDIENCFLYENPSLTDIYYSGTLSDWNKLGLVFSQEVAIHTAPEYTYTFIDDDGAVILSVAQRENSTINPPSDPSKEKTQAVTYEFVGWDGFTEGMLLNKNYTFKAIYKTIPNQYTYSFLNDGVPIKTVRADYGTHITAPTPPETTTEWFYNKTFTGWTGYVDDMILTEDVSFTANYARQLIPNKSQIEGASTADVGAEGVEENVYFSSDSSVKSAVFEITHSNDLELASVTPVDFKYATINEATSKNGFTTSKIVAVYSGTDSISSDIAINPFAVYFKVLTTANTGNTSIRISKITLNLDDGSTKEITETLSQAFEITPRKVDSIKIRAVAYGSGYTRYEAIITPSFATNQKIVWSVDNESIATITKDGTLYPKQNGTVVIKAETEDGEVSDTLSVNVKAYAKIASLKSNVGVWNRPFNENRRSYMIVVKPNVNSITLTPEYSQGIVMHDSKILLTNTPLSITLDGELTTVVLTCSGVEDTTDSKYTFNIVRTSDLAVIEETPPSRSDGTFDINVSLNGAPENTRVYVGIYDYSGCLLSSGIADSATGNETVTITPSAYRNAERYKIFLWNGSNKMQPVCDPYEGELY